MTQGGPSSPRKTAGGAHGEQPDRMFLTALVAARALCTVRWPEAFIGGQERNEDACWFVTEHTCQRPHQLITHSVTLSADHEDQQALCPSVDAGLLGRWMCCRNRIYVQMALGSMGQPEAKALANKAQSLWVVCWCAGRKWWAVASLAVYRAEPSGEDTGH